MAELKETPISSTPHAQLHPALRQLFDELARDDAHIDSGVTWIAFLSKDALIDASLKRGEARIRIRAYSLADDHSALDPDEVVAWVAAQPRPGSGVLQAFTEENEDGSEMVIPRLVFERPVEEFSTDYLEADIYAFAEAWESRGIAVSPPTANFELGDPARVAPQNAWLLMGDNASYPTTDDLAEALEDNSVGIYDYDWTAPKNGELGDLAILYFVAPKKAACFVARFASRPFWRTDLHVNAEQAVGNHQWWAYLTAPIEIEPIAFPYLQSAAGGFLALRGRSGHYLTPDAIARLEFTAANPDQQGDVDRIVQVPSGRPGLPAPETMVFEEWKEVPNGLLPLEAKVSEYIVGPLARFVGQAQRFPAIRPSVEPEYKVSRGFVDFVLSVANVPLLAIEVKLAIQRPPSGVWLDSPDFVQLKRYMNELDVPGLLVDAHSILVVAKDEDHPTREIVRSTATAQDIQDLQELVFLEAHEAFGGTGGIPSEAFAHMAPTAPEIYFACVPIWNAMAGGTQMVPAIAVRALSPNHPATEAIPLLDTPFYRELSKKFLEDVACSEVARRYLGGQLMGSHGVATLLGGPIPEERTELLELFGGLYAPRGPVRRRVARRG